MRVLSPFQARMWTAAVMSVVMYPGVTVLTVMPLLAVSSARLMVRPNMPDLAAA